MASEEMRKFVEQYVESLNSHDIDRIEQFHAPDSVSESQGAPGKPLGRAERREYFKERQAAFPDARMKIKDLKVDPEKGYATFEWTIEATHKGPFKGIAPTNKRVVHQGSTELWIKDGKIVREVSRQDLGSIMKQLGVDQPVGPGGPRR